MDSDKFISTNKISDKNMFVKQEENNFFLQSDGGYTHIPKSEPIKHLNDYDSNIIQEGAYREVPDEVFKLEYQISKIEESISELEKQTQLANEVGDNQLVERLVTRKKQLQNDLKILNEEYKNLSISAKISSNFSSKVKDKFISTKNILGLLGENLISKLPGRLSSFLEIKNSLTKLENINKSVDELMSIHHPYGDAGDKYEKLSKYIARANSIQAEISKFIK